MLLILRIKTAPLRRAEIVELIGSIIGPTEAQPSCLSCRLYSETEDDDSLVLLQEWKSLEDLNKFVLSRDFKRVMAAMDLASQVPEFSVNTVASKLGWEFVEKLRLPPQAP
jgi:quinol monooxygenase YgiN